MICACEGSKGRPMNGALSIIIIIRGKRVWVSDLIGRSHFLANSGGVCLFEPLLVQIFICTHICSFIGCRISSGCSVQLHASFVVVDRSRGVGVRREGQVKNINMNLSHVPSYNIQPYTHTHTHMYIYSTFRTADIFSFSHQQP
jgi:hypothetical protein